MTDKPIRFSKAPPPIVPINATGYRPPSKPKPIDWEHWRLMPIVELQQAVVLSVNVNPDDDTLVNDVLIRRMEIALSHVQAKTLTLDSHYPNVPLSRVSLAKFAAWALKLGIPNLPPELIAMAATEPTTAPDGDDLARRDFLARKNPDTPHSPEYLTAQALYYRGEADRLDRTIKEWNKASAATVREVAEKQRTLSELTAKLDLMNEDALFWESQQPAPAQTPATPAPVVAACDAPAPLTTESAWSPITSLARTPGYRWPLYEFLKAAHTARQPCPKAQDVLNAWKLKPPPGMRVLCIGRRDVLNYQLEHGGEKNADLKAVQAAIRGLIVRIEG